MVADKFEGYSITVSLKVEKGGLESGNTVENHEICKLLNKHLNNFSAEIGKHMNTRPSCFNDSEKVIGDSNGFGIK